MNSLPISIGQIEMLPWYAFGLYWVITAFRVKSTKFLEPVAARVYTMALLGLVFALLFSHSLKLSWLYDRFLPYNSSFVWAGIALTYAGVGIAIWARTILGANWSARVAVKDGHELVRTGPYAYVRHPIYTGLLLAISGAALQIGEWRGLVAVAVIAIAHTFKAKREEAAMIGEFGEKYEVYRRKTGFLFPGI